MTQEMLQVLGEGGKLNRNLEPKLSEQDLKRMYEIMVLTRHMDERGVNLQRQGRIGFYIGAMGNEATTVGSGFTLEPDDWYFPHYRDAAVLLLRSNDLQRTLNEMFCQMHGNTGDIVKGRQMPNHYADASKNFFSISSPLTTQVPQAVGAAYAMKYLKKKTVTMTAFGDGSTSEGDFHVGMNFAAVWKTPTVFICQNNHWAISVPLRLQTGSEGFAVKAVAYGMDGVRVDGNDVLAVYSVAQRAVERARSGGGPTLIEAVSYRMGPHSSSDDHTRYVDMREFDAWKKKDAILRFQEYLKTKGVWTKDYEDQTLGKARDLVTNAIKHAETFAPPPVESMFEDVYEAPTWLQEEQKRDLQRFKGGT